MSPTKSENTSELQSEIVTNKGEPIDTSVEKDSPKTTAQTNNISDISEGNNLLAEPNVAISSKPHIVLGKM